MHFHILGAGAVGLWTGYHLRRHGHRVTLLLRSDEAVAKFRQHNFIRLVAKYDGSNRIGEVMGIEAKTATHIHVPIKRLLITTKAYQTRDAFASVYPWLTKHSNVILLQNGMGVREQLLEQYYNPTASTSVTAGSAERLNMEMPRFAHGVTSIGCMCTGINQVDYTGTGQFCFGPAVDFETEPNDDELYATLLALHKLQSDSAYPVPMDAATIHTHMLTKLTVNACINPVTALLGCSNGKIHEQVWGKDMFTSICHEIAGLLQKVTAEPRSNTPFNFPPFNATQRQMFDSEKLMQTVFKICEQTAGNRSSMLVDVESGRNTEIDFINGYLVRLGQAFSCATPLNSLLWQLVHARTCLDINK
ncbi:ketopantoate reductase PanE/ApbA C terminal-domain-containing protein [Syncephalis fuscata]|nr:ketopantoate reductase PanE/ApbA C terminal-domain-containing protein [Syncephalis fuscata]